MNFMYDYMCCRKCMNNPLNNPYASGICHCALPTMTGIKWLPSDYPITKFWLMDNTRPFQTVSEWVYDTFGIREY